ncbi:putative acetyltransferase [Camellia lanceoleosa]|uniref:Acetyltransferase n=1 Tax=Camellia lanceoleosa TaxID=1840588 RepID=A0ACC0G6F5_9ERIC|nr:putative acetyltransferase [Camellia lanceoleosa]
MEEIKLISTSVVQSSSHHCERIELIPWDLQLLLVGPIQKGLLFLKPTPSQQQQLLANTIIDHLKISFSLTLDFFPLLSGRLAIIKNNDNTSSFFVDCNNAGAHFIHTVADNITVNDILDPMYVPHIVNSFFPLNGVLNHEGVSKPLIAVQVTELIDGFFIGCTMNHVIGDGTSFWQFFNSWSEISRGSDNILRPPFLNRWFPSDDINCPIRIPFCSDELDNEFIVPTTVEQRVFHFTKEKIAKLKAKANAGMNTTTISSLQALLAHLWQFVVRCQITNDTNQEVRYEILIGARQRLKPSPPEGYFGNAIHVEIENTTVGELLENGLGWAALQINKAVALQTNEVVRNYLNCWVKNPKLVTMRDSESASLYTSSSPRFNVYGNDLGWGKPVAVRSGLSNKSDGKVTLFPGVEEGSIDIEVCLLPEKFLAMEDDKEFM